MACKRSSVRSRSAPLVSKKQDEHLAFFFTVWIRVPAKPSPCCLWQHRYRGAHNHLRDSAAAIPHPLPLVSKKQDEHLAFFFTVWIRVPAKPSPCCLWQHRYRGAHNHLRDSAAAIPHPLPLVSKKQDEHLAFFLTVTVTTVISE